MLIRTAVFLVAVGSLACSESGTPASGNAGTGGGNGGPRGTGAVEGGVGQPGGGACRPYGGDGHYGCPAGSPAIACDLPGTTRELLKSGDRVYVAVDHSLLEVTEAGVVPVVELGTPYDGAVRRVLIDEAHVYYQLGEFATGSAKLMRRRLDGSDGPAEFWTCSSSLIWDGDYDAMTADVDAVFLSLESGIYRLDKSTVPARAILLNSGSRIAGKALTMAVDDTSLYASAMNGIVVVGKTSACACDCASFSGVTGLGNVLRCSMGGDAGTECSFPARSSLLRFENLQKFAFDTDSVFFANSETLYQAARDGGDGAGTPQALLGPGSPNPSLSMSAGLFTLDETSVYASVKPTGNPPSSGFSIARIPKGTSDVTVVYSETPPRTYSVVDMAVAAGVTYSLILRADDVTGCREAEVRRFQVP